MEQLKPNLKTGKRVDTGELITGELFEWSKYGLVAIICQDHHERVSEGHKVFPFSITELISPSKQEKALEYMLSYCELYPDQEIDADWLYSISVGSHTPTLDAMIVLFGSTEEIAKHLGTNLSYLIKLK